MVVAGSSFDPAVGSSVAGPSRGAGRGLAVPASKSPDKSSTAADRWALIEGQRRLDREFTDLEHALLQLTERSRVSDPEESAVASKAWTASRRLMLVDRCSTVEPLLSHDKLYAAASGQRALLQDQKNLLELLQSNNWTRSAEVERRWLPRFVAGFKDLKWLCHSVFRRENAIQLANLWLGRPIDKDRKTRVLLLAGGPTREYQFLRDQLSRNQSMIVDALLQTADTGTTQDVHQLLDRFPESDEKLAEYDAILAFDPDWESLNSNSITGARPIELLERWVGVGAGGLIVIAGQVNTDTLRDDPRLTIARDLYPVVFAQPTNQQWREQVYRDQDPCEIVFTRDGLGASFLRLADSVEASRRLWDRFSGIYGCYPVYRAKPGSVVYARLADATDSRDTELPIFIAGRSYGWGQVLYVGSGQLWRLNQLGDQYSPRLYAQLIEASQGRTSGKVAPSAMLARDFLRLVDGAGQLSLRLMYPNADRFLDLLDSSAVADTAIRAAVRIEELGRFYSVVGRLRALNKSQERLNSETRKVQKQSLILTDD